MPQLSEYAEYAVTFLPIVAMFAIFYLFIIRPQRKRDKSEKDMRASIAVGDEICTIGGFVGKIVSIKDDTLIIESTADRTKLKVHRWAVRGKEEELKAEEIKAAK